MRGRRWAVGGGVVPEDSHLHLHLSLHRLLMSQDLPGATLGSFSAGDVAAGVHIRSLVASSASVVTVSAVPEAETDALMLAGLGAVGWVARRTATRDTVRLGRGHPYQGPEWPLLYVPFAGVCSSAVRPGH